MNPPESTASAEVINQGAFLYGTHCETCHGPGVIQVGLLPDLRRSAFLHDAEAWSQVVIGGALSPNGMASFAPVMDQAGAQAIREFVILRANQDAPAEAGQ